MKYNVHVYVIVRVKILDVEATSQKETINSPASAFKAKL